MTDISSIAAFLGSVKTATEIAKAIKGADLTLERAELKFKIAELLESLADARIQAAEIQETLKAKDERVHELEDAWNKKIGLRRVNEAYYDVDESGDPIGAPYCSYCWEIEAKSVHLIRSAGLSAVVCPRCKTAYNKNYVQTFPIPT
jgi:hypothetical protein